MLQEERELIKSKELKGKNVGSCGQNTAERPFQMVLFFL